MKKLIALVLTLICTLSLGACFGYATRLPNSTYDAVNKITFGVNGYEYVLESKYHNSDLYDFVPIIKETLKSGKTDISNAFSQVKMPCSDSAVENDKESYEIWFELLIENGKYKKLFFTMNKSDTQTIWIYATTTDNYDDGSFLEYCSCDCKNLVTLAIGYTEEINIATPTKIEVTKYNMGKKLGTVMLTDELSIEYIVDNLTSLKLKELEYNKPTAIEYELVFFHANEEATKTISITLDGWIDYHGCFHSVLSGKLDIEYIAGLFE